MQNADTIAVFTSRSQDEILQAGGSEGWVLSEKAARQCKYVVCISNRNAAKFAGSEPHGTAFLIGTLQGLEQCEVDDKGNDRYLLRFDRYADLKLPDRWRREWRNPVKYTTLDELEVDVRALNFRPMPPATTADRSRSLELKAVDPHVRPLTIAQAKAGLALKFAVPIDAIEITIKG